MKGNCRSAEAWGIQIGNGGGCIRKVEGMEEEKKKL